MSDLTSQADMIKSMSVAAIERVRALEEITGQMEQADIETWHVLHGGMYSRTIEIPAGVVLTGALVKVPTVLVVNGDVSVFANDQEVRITGHAVIPASANRKQAFIAHENTWLTMTFKTNASCVLDAENEFTEEADRLMSRHEMATNHINITGE